MAGPRVCDPGLGSGDMVSCHFDMSAYIDLPLRRVRAPRRSENGRQNRVQNAPAVRVFGAPAGRCESADPALQLGVAVEQSVLPQDFAAFAQRRRLVSGADVESKRVEPARWRRNEPRRTDRHRA